MFLDPSQVAEQISHLPEVIDQPWAIPVAGFVAVAGYMRDIRAYKPNQSAAALDFRGNQAMLNEAIKDVATMAPAGEQIVNNPKNRFQSRRNLLAGAALTIGAFFANPSTVVHSETHNANVIEVIDTSNPMISTGDMNGGAGRFNAVLDGLSGGKYEGNVGIVQFGANDTVTSPLLPVTKAEFSKVNQNQVDPNGAELVPALTLADSLLAYHQPNGAIAHKGEIIIYTDGILNDTPAAIQSEANQLNKEGVKVKVIVPGTNQGEYQINGSQPFKASVEPENLAAFGTKNITVSSKVSEITSASRADANAEGLANNNQRWFPAYIPGVFLLWRGMRRYRNRDVNKIV